MRRNPHTALAAARPILGSEVACTSSAITASSAKENATKTLKGVIISLRMLVTVPLYISLKTR